MNNDKQPTQLALFWGDLSGVVPITSTDDAVRLLQKQADEIALFTSLEEILGADTYILDKVASEARSERSCIRCGNTTFWDFVDNTCRKCRGNS